LEAHIASDVKNIIYQANEWIEYAEENKFFFKAPSIKFVFCGGISESLSYKLRRRGVQVQIFCGTTLKSFLSLKLFFPRLTVK